MNSIDQIKQFEEEKNIEGLLDNLDETCPHHEEAKKTLIRIGDFAIDGLIERINVNWKKQSISRLKDYDYWKRSKLCAFPINNETFNSDIIADILGEIGNSRAVNSLIDLIVRRSPFTVRVSAGKALEKLGAAYMDNRKCLLVLKIPLDYYGFDKEIRYESMCPNCNKNKNLGFKDEFFDNLLGKDSELTMADGISLSCENCNKSNAWTDCYVINYVTRPAKKRWQIWK